jgi:hypothetical protein
MKKSLDYFLEFTFLTLSQVAIYYTIKYISSNPFKKRIGGLDLNSHETTVAKEIIERSDLKVYTFKQGHV